MERSLHNISFFERNKTISFEGIYAYVIGNAVFFSSVLSAK